MILIFKAINDIKHIMDTCETKEGAILLRKESKRIILAVKLIAVNINLCKIQKYIFFLPKSASNKKREILRATLN